MLNNHGLRIARRLGAFAGEIPCNCITCNEERDIRERKHNKMIAWIFALFFGLLFWGAVFSLTGCVQASEIKASWYSKDSLIKEGTRKAGEPQIMANGRVFDENALTVATRLYPLGTRLLITNKVNSKSVLVVVTDRIGKRFAKTRIDLSKRAFQKIADLKSGLIMVDIKKIS